MTPPSSQLEFDDQGFWLKTGETQTTKTLWTNVLEIAGYKHDLYTVDEICLGIRTSEDGAFVELPESLEGFTPFQLHLAERFSFSPMWYVDIMTPAFETCWTSLYGTPLPQEKWQWKKSWFGAHQIIWLLVLGGLFLLGYIIYNFIFDNS